MTEFWYTERGRELGSLLLLVLLLDDGEIPHYHPAKYRLGQHVTDGIEERLQGTIPASGIALITQLRLYQWQVYKLDWEKSRLRLSAQVCTTLQKLHAWAINVLHTSM